MSTDFDPRDILKAMDTMKGLAVARLKKLVTDDGYESVYDGVKIGTRYLVLRSSVKTVELVNRPSGKFFKSVQIGILAGGKHNRDKPGWFPLEPTIPLAPGFVSTGRSSSSKSLVVSVS